MSHHQSSKYGNILFVFCGGGCKAVIQAVAAAELVNAGLTPTHIVSSSAGTCNALAFVENPGVVGAAKALRIWEEHITSPEAVYDVHPFLREKLARLLGVVPQATHGWGPSGSIPHDLRRAIKFLPLVMSFCVRMPFRVAGRTVSFVFRLMDAFASQHKSFRRLVQAPEIQEAFDEMDKYFEFKRMKAFLDPFPILTRLGEQIDLQKVLTSPIVWHILAERYEDGATVVFSNKDSDLAMDGSEDARSRKAKHDLFFSRIRASMALYPLFEMVELDGYRYLDADLGESPSGRGSLQRGMRYGLHAPQCSEKERSCRAPPPERPCGVKLPLTVERAVYPPPRQGSPGESQGAGREPIYHPPRRDPPRTRVAGD